MALTTEQQWQVDMQNGMEKTRHENNLVLEARRGKIEAMRTAKESLVENRRTAPADAAGITAVEIVQFATALTNYLEA